MGGKARAVLGRGGSAGAGGDVGGWRGWSCWGSSRTLFFFIFSEKFFSSCWRKGKHVGGEGGVGGGGGGCSGGGVGVGGVGSGEGTVRLCWGRCSGGCVGGVGSGEGTVRLCWGLCVWGVWVVGGSFSGRPPKSIRSTVLPDTVSKIQRADVRLLGGYLRQE